jgi:hypothetical protein
MNRCLKAGSSLYETAISDGDLVNTIQDYLWVSVNMTCSTLYSILLRQAKLGTHRKKKKHILDYHALAQEPPSPGWKLPMTLSGHQLLGGKLPFPYVIAGFKSN